MTAYVLDTDRLITYLEQEDYLQLVVVNHALYNAFIASLYETVELYGSEGFESFSKGPKPFQLVKNFTCNIYKHREQLSQLSTLLPFLNSLTVHTDSVIAVTSFVIFQRLESLTLVTHDCDEIFLSTVLTATPYLKYLEIGLISRTLSIESLETINRLCPLLEYLHLTFSSIQTPVTDELDSDYQRIKLKSLKIDIHHDLPHHQLWLQYVGKRYPNIESLSFENGCLTQPAEHQYSAEFYKWFFSSCPYLNSISWTNTIPDDMLLANLNSQQKQLQKLYLCATHLVMNCFIGAMPSRYMYFSSIINLEISLLIPCDTLIRFLSKACPQLQRLKVDSSVDGYDSLSMNDVLDLLPSLNSLSTSHCQLYDDNPTQQQKQSHPLKELTIELVNFSGSLFD
ncbi:hypothetical protein EDC96DRAFT_584365 [Choanephora cucurbitarum]|nr:hypothetical protein EDC96DRAFT_584365 [Choanephora cucurbitarum]